jgi:hypothetical protein
VLLPSCTAAAAAAAATSAASDAAAEAAAPAAAAAVAAGSGWKRGAVATSAPTGRASRAQYESVALPGQCLTAGPIEGGCLSIYTIDDATISLSLSLWFLSIFLSLEFDQSFDFIPGTLIV